MNRKKIGILYTFGNKWMGGVIYIINLIKSLNKLPDSEKPQVIVFYNQDSKPYINQIQYPYIEFVYQKTRNPYINYLGSVILNKNLFEGGLIDKYKLDGIFPLNDFPVGLGKNKYKAAAWFPDLQHKFYPQYFTRTNLFFRELRVKLILKKVKKLALSSKNVYDHFNQFYLLKNDLKVQILRFTSIMEDIELPDINKLREKYQLGESAYFIVSNQFWGHKDHLTVFKAIKILKDRNLKFKVVFTGKMEDKRNPTYINDLKNKLDELSINDFTIFVGMINRGEQLSIMKNSLAIIQPSLFEGWSTVIEDGKALGCQIIASDLDVNLEQLNYGEKGFIFKQQDENSLAELMSNFILKKIAKKPIFENYNELTIDFARNFVNIFN